MERGLGGCSSSAVYNHHVLASADGAFKSSSMTFTFQMEFFVDSFFSVGHKNRLCYPELV